MIGITGMRSFCRPLLMVDFEASRKIFKKATKDALGFFKKKAFLEERSRRKQYILAKSAL